MMKTSIVIPFYKRHNNLEQVLHSLMKQSDTNFEVIVCAYLPDQKLKDLLSKSQLDFTILEVDGIEWNVAKARNAGITYFNNSSRILLILLDSDIYVSSSFVENHKKYCKPNCVTVGWVSGLDPYCSSQDNTIDQKDTRWKYFDPNTIPVKWPLSWSPNISVMKENTNCSIPLFDSKFKGWGAEDMEWAYQMRKLQWDFQFIECCNGTHLPHDRDVEKNTNQEKKNLSYFFQKWPEYEIEIISWLNDFEGCKWFSEYRTLTQSCTICCTELLIKKDYKILLVGFSHHTLYSLHNFVESKRYQLLGVNLPFESNVFQLSYIHEDYQDLPERINNRIFNEVTRVSNKVEYCTPESFYKKIQLFK